MKETTKRNEVKRKYIQLAMITNMNITLNIVIG